MTFGNWKRRSIHRFSFGSLNICEFHRSAQEFSITFNSFTAQILALTTTSSTRFSRFSISISRRKKRIPSCKSSPHQPIYHWIFEIKIKNALNFHFTPYLANVDLGCRYRWIWTVARERELLRHLHRQPRQNRCPAPPSRMSIRRLFSLCGTDLDSFLSCGNGECGSDEGRVDRIDVLNKPLNSIRRQFSSFGVSILGFRSHVRVVVWRSRGDSAGIPAVLLLHYSSYWRLPCVFMTFFLGKINLPTFRQSMSVLSL
jgi:hypothetical protein